MSRKKGGWVKERQVWLYRQELLDWRHVFQETVNRGQTGTNSSPLCDKAQKQHCCLCIDTPVSLCWSEHTLQPQRVVGETHAVGSSLGVHAQIHGKSPTVRRCWACLLPPPFLLSQQPVGSEDKSGPWGVQSAQTPTTPTAAGRTLVWVGVVPMVKSCWACRWWPCATHLGLGC